MGVINLANLQPNKTYNVMVRAKNQEGEYSDYSNVYTFTVPSTVVDQYGNSSQLISTNSTVISNIQKSAFSANTTGSVVGGAITAGGLDSNGLQFAGGLNLASVWNSGSSGYTTNTALTGSQNSGAVIINSTGILGYQFASAGTVITSSGQPNFFLSTVDGNAYFRGTIYAGAGNIGGWTINSLGLQNDLVGIKSPYNSKIYRVNLIYNPSFSSNLITGWTGVNFTITASSTYAYKGTYSLKSKISSSTTPQYISTSGSAVSGLGIDASSGTYTLSTYVYLPSSNTADSAVYLSMLAWTGAAYTTYSSASTTITRGTWTRISLTATMPASTTYILPRLYTNNSLAVGQEIWTDAWLLETGSDLLDYFDGDDFVANWTGTYRYSQSTMSEPAFYAGSANSGRYNAPFIVSYDGTVRASDFSLGPLDQLPASVSNFSTSTAITSWTYSSGRGAIGRGPESGRILVTLSGYIESDGNDSGLSVRISSGSTLNPTTGTYVDILPAPTGSDKNYYTLVNNAAGANGFFNAATSFIIYSEYLKNRDFNIALYYLAEDTSQSFYGIYLGWYPLP